MNGSDMVGRRRHQQCLTAAIRAQASVVQTDDPLEITSADQRHVGRDPELELTATTDLETNMTYAIIGAGLAGASLARLSPPRTFPSSSPTRAAPKPSTNSPQGSGHASRLCRLSVLHRTFRAEQEGLRVELTRSASSQRMAAINAFETFKRRLEST
jgi:hypothetical protein